MADDLNDVIERAALDLQGMLNTGFISEDDEGLYEAFGGKKGAGRVAVPDKLTDKQILAYFDFIGTPLTSKSEKTSVLNAVRENMVDRPTSINKNKSTAGAMVDALRVELKELQSFKTVDPDVLGGKAGKPIPVPKKFTAEQTVAFMKQFPNMFPLADENAYFGIARALTEESPDLFDVASFDAYEEKFGKTMEMQQKGASASKNITTAKTPEAANKPVADLDPKTATLREVAQAYADKSGRGKTFMGPALQYFRDIADEPGSALRLFEKDAEGRTLLSKTLTSLDENAPVKAAMQNLRQVGLLLKENVGPDTPEYGLLPDEKPDTALNKRIFGRAEPPKAEAQIAISSDPKKQAKLFEGVSQFLDNPETRPAALAILFNLNTGLRPNAVLNLTLDKYFPDTGAIYIEADVRGAKGRAVNIPLNPVADSILQELLEGKKPGDKFFIKSTGAAVKTDDMNEILRAVKVPQIMYDQSTKKFYDSLHPEDGPGKTGSPLLRNVHSSVALSLGIPQERTAYLQGRSLKAASKGSTGELTGYQKAFPGEVSDIDREFSSQVSSFYGKSAIDAGFDIQTKIPMPETRITTQTAGYEGYFDLPVREEVPVASQPTTAPASVDEAYPGMAEKAAAKGVDLNKLLAGMADKLGGKLKTVVPLAAGIELGRQFIDAPLATAGELAKEVGLEGAARVAGFGAAPAAAVPMALAATPTAGPELSEMPPQRTDFIPAPEVEETDEDRMARIATEDAGFIPEAAPAEQQGFLSR